MSWGVRWIALAALFVAGGAAQTPTFSGHWKLDPARSAWGRKLAPAAISLDIDHQEPFLKYSGIVVDADGEARQFDFSGATDGKEYPAIRPCGDGKVVLERVGPYAILATFKSNDGAVVERTRLSLSRDMKILTYRVELSERGGTTRWTEIYEKH
jgi:hypothetical protein